MTAMAQSKTKSGAFALVAYLLIAAGFVATVLPYPGPNCSIGSGGTPQRCNRAPWTPTSLNYAGNSNRIRRIQATS